MTYLPKPPQIGIEVLEETTHGGEGFLFVKRNKVNFHFPSKKTKSYTVDVAERKRLHAVAVVPYRHIDDQTLIYLRSAIRPAIAIQEDTIETGAISYDGNLWEIPAGLIESNEDAHITAQRELMEEMGFDLPNHRISRLGYASHSAVGICGETISFFAANVANIGQTIPSLDGSPMEEGAAIYAITADDAMNAILSGEITDMKTELGIRRFLENK